jgi:CubicO group peptidase (beta-lactamase class C family)
VRYRCFALMILAAAMLFCRISDAAGYQYSVPVQLKDGWTTADLRSENFDVTLIERLIERIRRNTYKNIHSLLLIKNGKLILEEYFPGQEEDGKTRIYQRDTQHGIHSVTKSVNSLLIGIAIDQKLIKGVDEKLSTFFPEYKSVFENKDSGKDAICLKHLLSMTAGLAWDESSLPYTDARNDHVGMNHSEDQIRYVLERPLVAAPGTKFNYSSGISIVLGEIIHKVSGMRADKFAEQHLFKPLGISDYTWSKYPNGLIQTGGGLFLRPRDMGKIGYLLLNGGRWQGKPIVSETWLRESTKQQAPDRTYGYQWWLGQLPVGDRRVVTYGALGRGGQFILAMPELQLVAICTGWNDGNGLGEQAFDMLKRFVLPADHQLFPAPTSK